ncbi:MAG: 50S ribosomal protein L29 [Patescibacteria group bacterium]|jgi:large subunit ribosomal protein L29
MNIKELNLKEVPELKALLSDAKKKLDELKFKVHQGQLKSVREIRVLKKDIALILTALASKNN